MRSLIGFQWQLTGARWPVARSCLAWATLGLALAWPGCGDSKGAPDAAAHDATPADAVADAPAVDANPNNPMRLFETGFCADAACVTPAADVVAYRPQFTLYTDGAAKRRWIRLPAGAKIDTADMDYWQFPVGTQLWKEFALGGKKIEMRYMRKTGPDPDQWFYVSFAWNEAQTDAVAVPQGVQNALGTTLDIPARAQCRLCHERVTSRVLGFAALSLDFANDTPGEVDLSDAITRNWLTAPPAGAGPVRFALPGGVEAQAALGYLHSNCGHCHNPTSDVHAARPLELRLLTTRLGNVGATPAYTTAVNVAGAPVFGADTIVKGGDTDGSQSTLFLRFTAPQNSVFKMPQLGTEIVDVQGRDILLAWIRSLAP